MDKARVSTATWRWHPCACPCAPSTPTHRATPAARPTPSAGSRTASPGTSTAGSGGRNNLLSAQTHRQQDLGAQIIGCPSHKLLIAWSFCTCTDIFGEVYRGLTCDLPAKIWYLRCQLWLYDVGIFAHCMSIPRIWQWTLTFFLLTTFCRKTIIVFIQMRFWLNHDDNVLELPMPYQY